MPSFYESEIFNDTLEGTMTDWFNETVEEKSNAKVALEYLIPIIFALIFIISVLGNGTLITIFVKERHMRNISNIYIMSLTLSGLLVTMFCVPFISLIYTIDSWPWGTIICKSTRTISVLTDGVPAFTLVALSIERYLVFTNRFRKAQIKRWTISSVILIWLLGCIISLPTAIFSHVHKYRLSDDSILSSCYDFSIDVAIYIKYDAVLKALVQYIIPFLIITCLYILMARSLHIVQSTSSLNLKFNDEQSFNEVTTKQQLDWMVLSLAIVFFICFLPHYIYLLWSNLDPDSTYDYHEYASILETVDFCLSMFYCCVNPIVLYFVSDTYKLHLKKYIFFVNSKKYNVLKFYPEN